MSLTDTLLSFEEVEEGNKVICDFIHLEKQDTFSGYRYLYHGTNFTDVFFHSSFYWLAPVIDKIERLGYDTNIIGRNNSSKLEHTFIITKQGTT
jgi:hypothetical protein